MKKTIANDLFLKLILILIICIVSLSAVVYSNYVSTARMEMKKEVTQVTGILSTILAFPLWNLDDSEVKTILNSYYESSHIIYIGVFDEENNIFYETSKEHLEELNKSVIDTTAILHYKNKKIGSFRVAFTTESIEEVKERIVLLTISFIALVIFLMAGGIFIILKNVLQKSIDRINQGLTELSKGNYTFALHSVKYSDLNMIVDNVNNLGEQLTERTNKLEEEIQLRAHVENELRKLNLHLEEKVRQRTQQFAEMNEKLRVNEGEIKKLNAQLEEKVIDRTEKLRTAQKNLLINEHKSEIADITTGTLHNVKNILNSVKVSSESVQSFFNGSGLDGFKKANGLLKKNLDDFKEFINNDPKGMKLMNYYLVVEQTLMKEKEKALDHLTRLLGKVDNIEKIVSAQQGYGGGDDVEKVVLLDIIKDALTMHSNTIEGYKIVVTTKVDNKLPNIYVQKTKLMHILINIIKNAREAMSETPEGSRFLTFNAQAIDEQFAELRIKDNGCGIDEENLKNMFFHGFTTKNDGHGFGLHSCKVYMGEMGGDITVESAGVGKGATFVLTIPFAVNVTE